MKKMLNVFAVNSKLPESAIIERILHGEKELFELLMRRHNQQLFRVVRSYLKNFEEIEDIMQNTYLKAFEKLYQYRQQAQFSTWLIRIGINESLKKIRENNRHSFSGVDTAQLNIAPAIPVQYQSSQNPEVIIIRQELKQYIEAAIDLLDVKYRLVFVLKEVEGMSLKEIADSLDLSVSNVKVRLHRAKSMLKDRLYEIHENQEIFEFGFQRCDELVERVMIKLYA